MKVKDAMQRNVVSVTEDESMGLALQLMRWNEVADAAATLVTKGLGCLAVIDAGELVGVITPSDVMSTVASCAIEPPEQRAHAGSVASIMHADPLLATAKARGLR